MARFERQHGGAWRVLVATGLVAGIAGGALADVSDPGTHLFESDFFGSSHEVYNTTGARSLVEGWNGALTGSPGSSGPYTDIESGVLSFKGSIGARVNVTHELSGIPSDFTTQIRFRRDEAHSSLRHDFTMFIGGVLYFAGGGGASGENQFGVAGNSVLLPLDTGVWYTMEVIDRRGLIGPSEINLQGDNFTGPQRSVDWVTMDAAGAGGNLLEMRIWADGDARPEMAQVLIVPSPGSMGLLGIGGLVATRRRR